MKKDVKVVFFGTPEFTLPTLKALYQEGYNIVLVITQPDKPVGRKQIITPSPVKVEAKKLKLKVIEDLKIETLRLRSGQGLKDLDPDVGIVVAYGKIIPKEILDLFPNGCLNIHPSLLPKYRGPSPIQAAILSGDKETGITIIELDEKMDHGPIIQKAKVKIQKSDTAETLHDRLAQEGAKLLIKTLPDYLFGKVRSEPQNDNQASYTQILKREDGKIDWKKSAKEIERQIRAYYPWPGSFTNFVTENRVFGSPKVKILSAQVADDLSSAQPGLFNIKIGQLYIQCGKGSLLIKKLQPEGGKEMTGEEFIRGYMK